MDSVRLPRSLVLLGRFGRVVGRQLVLAATLDTRVARALRRGYPAVHPQRGTGFSVPRVALPNRRPGPAIPGLYYLSTPSPSPPTRCPLKIAGLTSMG